MDRNNLPPVAVNDEFEVEITSMGKTGDGVTKFNGYILFVKNAAMGEKVNVRVTRALPNYGFAEVVD